MAGVTIDALTKTFGSSESEIIAVDDLNISIEDGEFVIFVGPSGCGKSTTLRCIAGLEDITEGEIYLDDEPISDDSPRDRDIAMVFQNYALYPHMTARENMGFGLKMSSDLSSAEIDERVEDAAAIMGIEDLLEKSPAELSGGQQQRIALGRAIVRDPQVFLMDEPLSNLDAKLRTQMRTELQSLHQDLDVTTIYVTHDQTEAMTMGDRIVVLDGGQLQQMGTPLECYHQPANIFVAGFIGSPSMNFLDVTRIGSDEPYALENKMSVYELSHEMSALLEEQNEELVLGIRPQDIELAEAEEPNQIAVTASVVEPLGNETFVYFDMDGDTFTASIEGEIFIEEGDVLNIVFPEDKIHIFDRETGTAIKNRDVSQSHKPAIQKQQ